MVVAVDESKWALWKPIGGLWGPSRGPIEQVFGVVLVAECLLGRTREGAARSSEARPSAHAHTRPVLQLRIGLSFELGTVHCIWPAHFHFATRPTTTNSNSPFGPPKLAQIDCLEWAEIGAELAGKIS